MSNRDGIVTFNEVSFHYEIVKPLLKEASFTVRRGAKLTLMGQNGAGKSTLFSLITGEQQPLEGDVNILPRTSIAIAKQVIPRDEMEMTTREFFEKTFSEKVYDIDPRIDEVLDIVNLTLNDKEKKIGTYSGGQQARLLLAQALIQKPDILLLDEPTNNLDPEGIAHLTQFLKDYNKTVLVISHDAEFLNAFTNGVLYLNFFTKQVERFTGNYNDVLEVISAQIEKEERINAQLQKKIEHTKEKANYFANKSGTKARAVGKKFREKAAELEEDVVEVRRDDKVIRNFKIPCHKGIPLRVLHLSSYVVMKDHEPVDIECDITLERNRRLQIIGPNGIGKTTLLESLAGGHAKGEEVADGVKIGYYRQDFSNLDPEQTVHDMLMEVMVEKYEQDMRSVAAGFLINAEVIGSKIGNLSEGQKGLVAFARLVLMKPGLLILDEPTNHINFRHIPVIAKALHDYEGTMILVSHVPEFVSQIRIDETLDLSKAKPPKKKKEKKK